MTESIGHLIDAIIIRYERGQIVGITILRTNQRRR